VRVAYDLILDTFYKPVSPSQLVNAAWSGALNALSSSGISPRTPRPQPTDDREQVFNALTTAWQALSTEVAGRVDFTQVAFAADDAMANSVNDDHTYFLTPDEFAQDQQALGGADSTRTGLGIRVNTVAPHVVTEVAPGGPADKAGLRAGDTIIAINGHDVQSAGATTFNQLLQGPAGTAVSLTVSRPSQGTLTLTATIGPYVFPLFSAKVLPNNVGYMQLRSFNLPWVPLQDGLTVTQELDAALASFEQAGVTTWILDLRNNLGGASVTSLAFAGRFLKDGEEGANIDARGNRGVYLVDGHAFPVQHPLAVLVNGNSASSSELLAATLKQYGRAVLVGSRTAGALGSALIQALPDGAGLAVTAAQVLAGPLETTVDQVGIPVDVTAGPPTLDDLSAGRDPAIDAAVAALAGGQTVTLPPNGLMTLPQDTIRAALKPYEVTEAEVPAAPEIPVEHLFGDYVLNTYNEWNDWEGPAVDGFAGRDLAAQRGWQGALLQFFGAQQLGPGIVVESDMYSSADGAAAAMSGNDFPSLLTPVQAPVRLGDQTIAFKGHWLDTGTAALEWRHGRVLFTVVLNTLPGEETFDPLVTLANAVEARYQATPLTDAGQ
jgi:carboxyl-terminal processing protease